MVCRLHPNLAGVVYALLVTAPAGQAAFITDPGDLAGLPLATVTFENLTGLDGQQFGAGAGQPYAAIGLRMGFQIVSEGANIGSGSNGIAVHSATIFVGGNTSSQSLSFDVGQSGVGFYYRDVLATGVTFEARDAGSTLLESFTVGADPDTRYGGFRRATADIREIVIFAPHATVTDAINSRTFIDDVSYTPTAVAVPAPPSLQLAGVAATVCTAFVRRRRIPNRAA